MASDLTAYCDESGKQHEMFCIAGYVAPAAEWQKLDAPWREALGEEGLSEFKMRDCEQGEREFADRTRQERARIQDRFITLVNSIEVHGVSSGIDLQAYEDEFKGLTGRRPSGYWKAYLRLFEGQVQLMATVARPRDEPIAFVFDRQDEFAGNAVDLFNILKESAGFRDRLGGVTFDDSVRRPALQAADLLAYEEYRFLAQAWVPGVTLPLRPDEQRWQMRRLKERVVQGTMMGRDWIRQYRDPLFGLAEWPKG